MIERLFNIWWWGPILLGGVGVLVFLIGNTRQQTQTRNIGLIVAALAVLLAAASYFVTTPVEQASKGTRDFVQAVVQRDEATLKRLLDSMASLTVLNSATPYSTGDAIRAAALQAKDQFGINSARILSLTPKQEGTAITVTIDVLSEQERSYGRPITTAWQFEWTETSEGLLITRITCLRIGTAEGDSALSQFPSGMRLPNP